MPEPENIRKDLLVDFYFGRAGSARDQQWIRERVFWTCNRVEGTDVLDIGCSGGLVSIFLGREGFNVTGVDNLSDAVDEANKLLEAEDLPVRERVRFQWGQGAILEFPDASFDTVIMGEVFEHLVHPERVLAEARRVIRTGGTLVLTTPLGADNTPDHKAPVYMDRLVRTLAAADFAVQDVELLRVQVGVVARAGGVPAPELTQRLLLVTEQRLRDVEQEFVTSTAMLMTTIHTLRAQIEAQSATRQTALEEARAQLGEARARAEKLNTSLNALRNRKAIRLLNAISSRRGKAERAPR